MYLLKTKMTGSCLLRLAVILAGGMFFQTALQAQTIAQRDSTTVYYKVMYTLPDSTYLGNGHKLDSLSDLVHGIYTNPLAEIKGISILSSASPEGRASQNKELSQKRGESIINIIQKKSPLPDSLFTITSIGEDWDGAIKAVEASDMNFRDKALNIMRNTPLVVVKNGKVVDSRKRQMMNLDFGRVWMQMVTDFFPRLRRAEVTVDYTLRQPIPEPEPKPEPEPEPEPIVVAPTNVPELMPEPEPVPEPIAIAEPIVRKPLFAVKTNLLYDAVSALNVAVEVPIKDHWSIGLEYTFPWWVWDNNSRAFEMLFWQGTGRYWFGDRTNKRVLTGWFAGINAGGGYYDFEPHHKGYQGEFYTASAEGGYAWNINDHWSFELSAGLGWIGSKYRHYEGMENDNYLVWQNSGNYTWLGPVKLNASIVYLFYHKVKKGGK